ncbi:MAG: hypothetical protein KDA75_04140, partial [Planctomycetaceae bacterium]|nr:hypothetical protein [Planctomycetaceae bacterium]
LARMPADYFVREQPLRRDDASHWAWWLAGKVFKNSLGGLLFLAGVAMLVLPGQGLITMLIGMTLIDFPGKRALELAIIRRPRILRTINWLRARSGKPPVITELSPDTPPEVHRR